MCLETMSVCNVPRTMLMAQYVSCADDMRRSNVNMSSSTYCTDDAICVLYGQHKHQLVNNLDRTHSF